MWLKLEKFVLHIIFTSHIHTLIDVRTLMKHCQAALLRLTNLSFTTTQEVNAIIIPILNRKTEVYKGLSH